MKEPRTFEVQIEDQPTTLKWFGKDWGAPVCKMGKHIPTPVGEECGFCDTLIAEDDHGLRMPFMGDPSGRGYMNAHHLCFLRSILPEHMIYKGQA